MLKQILTSAQSKDARRLAGVSQQTAATAAGVSRTHLALWEVNKYVLSDAALTALRDYYASTGYVFEDDAASGEGEPTEHPGNANSRPVQRHRATGTSERASPPLEGFMLIDGFLVPEALDHNQVEGMLAEIARNDAHVEELAARPATSLLFGGYCVDVSNDIALLMARNYALVQTLRGHDAIMPCTKSEEDNPAANNGDVLSKVFGKKLGNTDDEPESRPFGVATKGAKRNGAPAARSGRPNSGLIID